MFIRWRRRPLRRQPDALRYALLVHTRRVAGQPRQQLICYLASIREQYQHAPAHRQAFWRRAAERLATVPLDTATRQRLLQQLATRIPPPTAAELQQVAAQRAQLAQLAASLARDTPRPVPRPGGPWPGEEE